jgi:hypothetical protein
MSSPIQERTNVNYQTFTDVPLSLEPKRSNSEETKIQPDACPCWQTQLENKYAYLGLLSFVTSGLSLYFGSLREDDKDAISIMLKILSITSFLATFYFLYLHQR